MNVYKSGAELLSEIEATKLPEQTLALWAMGQEGFLMKWREHTVLFDPYLSDWVYESSGPPWSRAFEPPLAPSQCIGFDYVVCSHHHEDHMDKLTLQAIGKSATTKFIVPKAHLGLMKEWGFRDGQLIGISHGQTLELADGLLLEAHAAKHEQFETDEGGEHKFLGFVASFGGVQVYHAGDTVGFPELAEWLKPKRIDIAMLPINGRDFVRGAKGIVGNCNYREAIEIAAQIQADMLVPMHYGLFPHNDENPAYFVDYAYRNYPARKFHMFAPGERFIYMK
ncbi:MBL fold metallo-hydrolase [Paenibacillus harenae]|uniref:L-ascorbate metabolism protein UlaG (Beta-lactamase superfamily) n=1 Tax=Paenibacillus harenae TaxID=306543 RepID=A0ABT9TY69_PAEHA|nr:MBL fold metallo-hydrolase [Paenibacillus harenae]MDQ0112309.1 L-ascorbate metabolism protein UlaG (beta-lactamase superfamily) [Paenibacillus harenae]